MFVKQLNERFAKLFSGYNELEHGVFNAVNAIKFIGDSKRVRCKDYIFSVDIENGGQYSKELTSTANWFFILTNAAVWFDFDYRTAANAPRVRLTFPDNVVNHPFGLADIKADGVSSVLDFGREGLGRFEEYKNLIYIMGDRINMQCDVFANSGIYAHGAVLLTGVEVDLKGV